MRTTRCGALLPALRTPCTRPLSAAAAAPPAGAKGWSTHDRALRHSANLRQVCLSEALKLGTAALRAARKLTQLTAPVAARSTPASTRAGRPDPPGGGTGVFVRWRSCIDCRRLDT